MELNKIVALVNSNLAGELLTYSQIVPHLDNAIDNINFKLNTTFPAFSEFTPTDYEQYPDYDFIPDQYIRSVLSIGAAYFFYITDEEGIQTAPAFQAMFVTGMFSMERDFLPIIPDEYKKSQTAALTTEWLYSGLLNPTVSEPQQVFPDVRYVEGPMGMQGPKGDQGPPGVGISKIVDDTGFFEIYLTDGTIKRISKV